MKKNREWTNEERVTNYGKLLSIREELIPKFQGVLDEAAGTFMEYISRSIRDNNLSRISGLKEKIAYFTARPGRSDPMPDHLVD